MATVEDEERRRWFRREILPLEPLLYDCARRFCRRGEDPSDLVHETFARLIAHARWREVESPKAFAIRVLKNCAIDLSRRRNVVPIDAIADVERINIADPQPDPERALLSQQELRLFTEAVSALPTKCRQVFILRKVYNFSHSDIAARLGISVSTVEKHLVKGLRLCSEALARGTPAAAPGEARPLWDKATDRSWRG